MDIAFFIASNDAIAASARARGPWPAMPSVVCHDFYPDDAVVTWQAYFDDLPGGVPPQEELFHSGKGAWPRYVAPIVNDGTGVFVLPEKLVRALARATADQLRDLAELWAERLRLEDGDDMTDDDPLEILQGVAQLARTAVQAGDGSGVYCWHY
ncbi:hypothetical protein [Spirillospora sp. NPDC029432]|uniref:hypothetical protein n=1 Tax=Spirillospora sp. NPDC029432 TaxID=3154599 RepID=UPI003453FC18